MKVLVATREKQGRRKNDFSWADDGELVTFGSECSGERVDGHCGCRRSMTGVLSRKGTTTMQVVERDLTVHSYAAMLKESMNKAFPDCCTDEEAFETASELARIANVFPTSCVVERRGNKFIERN